MDRIFGELPPLIQEKKKYQNFTVTPIYDITTWRKEQAVKEAAYQARCKERDSRIAEFRASVGSIDSPTLSAGTWKDKLNFALDERKRLAKVEAVAYQSHEHWETGSEIKPSIFRRFLNFVKNVWKNANF